jgi:ComF family protein
MIGGGRIYTQARARFGAAGRVVIDTLLPPLCLSCAAPVDSAGGLCSACWGALRFLDGAQCQCCGYPFELSTGAEDLCAACLARRPAFARARAALVYDDASRDLVLAFKHRDRLEAARPFARMMARAGNALLREADIIVPVPLHRRRLFARRYNQAAVLALALGKVSGLAVAPRALIRTRRTESQAGKSRIARRRNVRGAFALRPAEAARIEGRRVLLVDDVLTTGATVEACATALTRAGAAAVDVLTLMRVVRPL